jgi:hypothetical protein
LATLWVCLPFVAPRIVNPLPLIDRFVTTYRHIHAGIDFIHHSKKEAAMRVHEAMFDEFFGRRLPDEGFTLEEVHDDYSVFLQKMREDRPELHGHVVTMDGTILVPELRPSAENRAA